MMGNPRLMEAMMTPENLTAAAQMMRGGNMPSMAQMNAQPSTMPMPGGRPTSQAA